MDNDEGFIGSNVKKILKNAKIFYPIVFLIIICTSLLVSFGINDHNNLSPVEKLFKYTAEPLTVSVCIGLIYYHFQLNFQATNLERQFEKYNNTIELAELLHQSKKKFGFKGLNGSVNEGKILSEIIDEIDEGESKPTIRWMNFRFEKIDQYSELLRTYLSKGGNIYIVAHCYYDEQTVSNRMLELKRGFEVKHGTEADPETYSNEKLYINGMIQRTARLIQFYDNVGGEGSNFHLRFNHGNIGVPLFIIEQDIHMEAHIGFYLLNRSSEMPYVQWSTSPTGVVRHTKSYFDFIYENGVTVEEMREREEIKKLLPNLKETE